MANKAGSLRLEGKTALVTGGTRGIGRSIAERYCQEGARVVIAGTHGGPGDSTAEQLRAEGHTVSFEPVDMGRVESIHRMVGAAAATLEGIDILVNNAGIVWASTIRRLEEASWDQIMAVNLRGPVFCMKAVGAVMAEKGRGGSIINMVSIAGIDGEFGLGSYAASKAGLIVATNVAAREFARDDIRVNAVAPGLTETDIISHMPEERKQGIIDNIPLGRIGMPEDIAAACTFLASDDGKYITGQTIRVDGGLKF